VEELLPGPEKERVDDEPVLVDESKPRELVDDLTAAVDEQVVPRLVLELLNRRPEVALDDRRVPLRPAQRSRRDELRHRVHLAAELSGLRFHRRPRGGEALVGDAAEDERVARVEVLLLEVGQLIVPVGRRPGGVLDDAVERDVDGELELSHATNSSSRSASSCTSLFATRVSGANGSTTTRPFSNCQVPASIPSTRIVGLTSPFTPKTRFLNCSGMTRVRSWKASSTLSHFGRKRTGAGVPASGSGAR